MASIRIRGLTKTFDGKLAVDHLSLDVKDGEYVCLLGPSGCGKTTTLRCIAGLEEPDEGEIYLDDELINHLPPAKRDIAMVFESFALYPHMTVYENMAFPLKKQKISADMILQRIKRVAKILQIEHLLEKDAVSLHPSEKQRVALGRALVREPKVLLLDEPLSNLDAKLRELMRIELKELQRGIGITTIHTTNDQLEAMGLADRIAVMKDGKLQQYDTPEEIYNNPSNIFVADFIGSPSINIIECKINEKNGKIYAEADGLSLDLSEKLQTKTIPSKSLPSKIFIGIRPNDIQIRRQHAEGACKAEVRHIELGDNERLLYLSIGGNRIRVLVPLSIKLNIGDEVWCSFNMNKLYFFDSEGSRIKL